VYKISVIVNPAAKVQSFYKRAKKIGQKDEWGIKRLN
jgi:hypothetical protein